MHTQNWFRIQCFILYAAFCFFLMLSTIIIKAWIPLSLSQHPSLLIITLGKSSRRHPVSTQSWWMQVFASQSTLAGVFWTTSLMSLSLLCQHCLVHFTWIVCEIGGKWLNSCFVECYFQDLFKTTCSILV